MSRLDLTDLRLLGELHRTGSISRTADKIGLSQPSVSVRLSRLRRHFKDRLFVRVAHALAPTPRGDRAVAAARQALELLEGAISSEDEFDAATSQRTFRICTTGIGQMAVLPRLLTRMKTVAPRICLDVLDSTGDIEALLEKGEADIAIGVRLERQKGLIAQTLFEERFVCLVSKNHRRLGDTLTLEQFLREAHVATNIRSASIALWILDQALEAHNLPQHIALRVPSLMGLSHIVANTDLLATVPLHIAMGMAEEGQVKFLELPIEVPSFSIVQYCHHRYHADPANRWLRDTIRDLFVDPAERRIRPATSKAGGTGSNRKRALV